MKTNRLENTIKEVKHVLTQSLPLLPLDLKGVFEIMDKEKFTGGILPNLK